MNAQPENSPIVSAMAGAPQHAGEHLSPEKQWQLLLAAAFGAILSPLLRVALALTQQTGLPAEVSLSYWCGVILFAIMGSGTAWGLRETNRQKAILLGLSLPCFIQLTVKDAGLTPIAKHQSERGGNTNMNLYVQPNRGLAHFSFVSSSLAAEPDAELSPTSRISQTNSALMVSVQLLRPEYDVNVTFLDAANRELHEKGGVLLLNHESAVTNFAVPPTAKAIEFAMPQRPPLRFKLIPGRDNHTVSFQVTTKTSMRYGLLSVFGAGPTEIKRFIVTLL